MLIEEQRLRVQAVLRDLLVGQRFCRAHFYGTPILYLWGPPHPDLGPWYTTDDEDAVNIWVEGRWQLYDATPSFWPRTEGDLPDRPIEELVGVACALRERDIIDARLGTESPHLILTFDNGRVLFINGHHEEYESWQVYAGRMSQVLIVAVPGDNLSMWLPKDYRQKPGDEMSL